MESNRKYYIILDFNKTKRGWIQYDVEEGEDLFKEQCVVIRKKSNKDRNRLDVKEYYILVVRLTSVDNKYKRVRVGLI